MRTILVPLDGSQFSEHSLPMALRIARRSGACLHLLNVLAHSELMWFDSPTCDAEKYSDAFRQRHQIYLRDISSRASAFGVKIQTTLVPQSGSISETISAQTKLLNADLVVLTTHGLGGLARVFLGSVADELIRQISTPLLAIRPLEDPVNLDAQPEINKILVPLDGTTEAENMIPSAAKLARIMEAEVTLLQVITPVPATKYHPQGIRPLDSEMEHLTKMTDEAQSHLEEKAQSYLHSVAEALRKQGISVSARLMNHRNPASAIIKTAEREGFDLIALETHGRSGLSRLFLGSVADKVLRSSSVPMLVHRPLVE